MQEKELKQVLTSSFDFSKWHRVIDYVFPNCSFENSIVVIENNNDKISYIHQKGEITLTDNKRIIILEVAVKKGNITKAKVGFHNLTSKFIDQANNHGILAFYIPEGEDRSDYRLSFICKESRFTEGGNFEEFKTNPRRYTYVLGENVTANTATKRLFELAAKKSGGDFLLNDVIEAFSVEALTKEFYNELSNWYFWALQNVKFPDDFEQDEEVRNATSTIRLITRLMFVWFLKQKGLIPDGLFDKEELKKILNYSDKTGSTFYKAILQNLFFATLNTDMSGDKRKFVNRQYGIQGFYRYERFFSNKNRFLELTRDIPFLNGGLFENLDKNVGESNEVRIDCFSNKIANESRLSVPDFLFFNVAEHADLSRAYGDSNHGNTKVRGLIEILKSYNFTIEENTPYEIEVALDPELLGKVFENLLASYNPETKTTARKQTGSFYTPREIVNYMVDESIVAYLKSKLIENAAGIVVIGNHQIELFGNETRKGQLSLEQKINTSNWVGKETELEDNLRFILAYNVDENPFDAKDTVLLIKAIDNCKILDPACGSGAFPMGVLQKMVHILQKLDKDNSQWRELQRQKAIAETEKAYNIGDKEERQKRLLDIDETFDYNASDYGRKLYLIENCIYGVDIQPIAVQIAKLRFFISLVCDQKEDKNRDNLGIRPLPNLETKFVAANSLISINRSGGVLRILEVVEKEKELAEVRHKHFLARTPETKAKYRIKDEELRNEIAILLKNNGWGDVVASLLAAWNPYDQNTSASFFDPEWMFGRSSEIIIHSSNIPSDEIKVLNLQLESINKQIDTINISLKSNHAAEILKLQFVSANIQVSIIEHEVKRLKSNIDELYGSVDTKVGPVVKEPEDVSYLIRSLNQAIKQINKQIAGFEATLKPVQKIESHDGFDIVIGNPPYVQLQKDGGKLAEQFINEKYSTFERTGDIYSLFYERGLALLKNNGFLTFITSNKWMRTNYGKSTRKFFIEKTTPILIVDFGNVQIFENATVDTNILILQNKISKNHSFRACRFTENYDTELTFDTYINEKIQSVSFVKDEAWVIAESGNAVLIDKIKKQGVPLKEWNITINYGIKTGLNEAFIIDRTTKDRLIAENPKCAEILKPILRGKDIQKWVPDYANLFIIGTFPSLKLNIDNYSAVKNWLANFGKEKLVQDGTGRKKTGNDWFETQDQIAYWQDFEKPKIIYPNMTKYLPFAYDENEHYYHNDKSFHIVGESLKWLVAFLNSTLFKFAFSDNFPELQGGTRELRKVFFDKIPVKQLNEKQQQPFITLVDRLLAAKKADPQADTLPWEAEIDARVFHLYVLTEEEILQVLNSLPSVSEGERREILAQYHLLK
jgi:tRNA1(Val) A37 N6-methylase TrmN6